MLPSSPKCNKKELNKQPLIENATMNNKRSSATDGCILSMYSSILFIAVIVPICIHCIISYYVIQSFNTDVSEEITLKLKHIQERLMLNFEYNSLLDLKYKWNLEKMMMLRRLQIDRNKRLLMNDQCDNVPSNLRFDCHPEDGASAVMCIDRGCCWNPVTETNFKKTQKVPLNIPYCYYKQDWQIYKYFNKTGSNNDFTVFMKNYVNSYYMNDIQSVRMDASSIDKSILRIKISDSDNKRYEPHLPVRENPKPFEKSVEDTEYTVETNSSVFGFRVNRNSDKTTIFDSIGKGGFIFADQFLQMSTILPSNNIYGLGEHRTNFKLNTNWTTLTLFNKDQPPTENANLYGSQPFYLVIEESGNCHGVLFLNSNAMDVILQPTPALTFRSIGGIFDIYFFMGPTPADVVKQYSQIVGKPFMPPYWSLGFHLCRYGYGSLEKTKEIWNRTIAAGIPFDTQWNDLDYMDNNNDFTYDKDKFKDLPEFLQEIKKAGMHYIPLIDAGISASETNGSYRPFDEGLRRNIFVTESDSDLPFKGKVWNRKSTVWPDFTNPATQEYWHDMMKDMWNMFPYAGAWIDMNEPSNFYDGHIDGCKPNKLDNPPYMPNVVGNLLATKTLCMNAKLHVGPHYDVHNTYGTAEAVNTNYALTKIRNLRPFVISRSSWVGLGVYAGHWSGDIFSSWYDMRKTVPQLLSFSLFQVPMMGADICGFNGNTTQALCNRWMQLGAFYPFSRNHNSDSTNEQDPVALGDLVVKSSRKALMIRYRFLPYLYTLFFRAHKFGETVARPLFFEFTSDKATYDIDSQFLWGSSLMILPVFEEGATSVTAYIPRGTWYEFYDKKKIVSNGKNYTFDAPLDTIPLLIRGGSILPAQTPSQTTTASRSNNFELLIAPDDAGKAKGELYWDDGESLGDIDTIPHRWLKFTLENQMLSSSEIQSGNYNKEPMILGKVQVMGVINNVNKVIVNGKESAFKYEKERQYLTVKNLQVDLTSKFTLSWN